MRRIHAKLTAVSSVILVVAGCAAGADYAGADLYAGFALVDPEAETVRSDAWIVVRDGLIVDIGSGPPPDAEFVKLRELTGVFAMPGLIDAHAHITAGPQRVSTVDGEPRIEILSGDDYSRSNGAIALAFGVTTVRNPAGSATANARYDTMIATGSWLGPEALHAGAVIQPPPFQGKSFAYPTTAEEWDAEAAQP